MFLFMASHIAYTTYASITHSFGILNGPALTGAVLVVSTLVTFGLATVLYALRCRHLKFYGVLEIMVGTVVASFVAQVCV
jgi:hypothetical protein